MADPQQVATLKRGADAWNAWRKEHPDEAVDLSDALLNVADLRGANLRGANLHEVNLGRAGLHGVDLRGADLTKASLIGAYPVEADLTGAKLHGANLWMANLVLSNLSMADLSQTDLTLTNFTGAKLIGADLSNATLWDTVLGSVNLSSVKGLGSCRHSGPSTLDHRTLAKSGPLPIAFLRGVGLPERLIEYLPSLLDEVIQFYACFISYSARDDDFTRRLHADLQDRGVRCWFAPEDQKTGARIRHSIDEAIRAHDKVLLILSEHSIASQWVEQEVEAALEHERQAGKTILFPIRLDDAIMTISSGWPRLLRNTRNIGDMRQWKDHDAYQKVLERLLRDLRAEGVGPAAQLPEG